MVAAKYLRSAPHPDTWDERGEALLKSLGNDKAKRRKVLKETLTALDTDGLVRKTPRPGRKTHAENAIAFYRHVLTMNDGDVESEEEEEEEEDVESEPNAPKVSKPHKMRVKRLKREGESGGESISSMDSEEFLAQHNDLCEVCNEPGELVCCSTCNLVFHLQCIRPPTTRFPPDKWCCAFCVAAGVRGHTKEARTRRRAAAAAREMTRMKEELNPVESNEAQVEKEKKPASEKKRGRPSRSIVASKEADEAEDTTQEEPPRKKRGTPPKEVDESNEVSGQQKTPQGTVEEDEKEEGDTEETAEGRARRRERRQPTLYNPQAVAASRWQSDGKVEWKTLGSEDDDTETGDDTSKGTDEASNTTDASVWCNFCHDDPSVPVCCFCACRKCFGKHDKSKILICDKCEGEFHIYCLDPPLKSVPHSKKWFCSTCKKVSKKEADPAPEASADVKRRGPGRPPKKAPQAVEDLPVLPKRRGRPPKKLTDSDDEDSIPVAKKRRGRPPKKSKRSPAAAASKAATADTPLRSNVRRKKRGRPPKTKSPLDGSAGATKTAAVAANFAPSKAKPAPAKSSSTSSIMPLVTPRSNPGLSIAASATKPMQTFPGTPQANVAMPGTTPQMAVKQVAQKSRSGRTVKRNTFHDEIYQNDQQPRSSLPSVDHNPKPTAAVTISAPTTSGASHTVGQGPPYQATMQQQAQKVPATNPASMQMSQPPARPIGSASLAQNVSVPAAMRPGMTAPTSIAPPVSAMRPPATYTPMASAQLPPAVLAYPSPVYQQPATAAAASTSKVPRRKPGARECMQISRRFGVKIIPQNYMDTLLDYCSRGKVEHLVRMRERLDDHSRMLETQLAGLEALVKEKGEFLDIKVPAAEPQDGSPP